MSDLSPLTRILVGVDFDEASGAALAAAGAMASAFNATLTAVHVHTLDMPAYFTGAQMDALEAERREAHARCAADLVRFAALHTTVAVTPVIEEGTPASAILRLAPSADLIVLGTHRRHGTRRWWLGSVAEAVVRQSAVPVLVVPAGLEPIPQSPAVQAGA